MRIIEVVKPEGRRKSQGNRMKDFSSDCGFISEPNVVEYGSTSMAEGFFGNENQTSQR
jgi:hypothetical protein